MTDLNCVVVQGRLTEGLTEKNFGFVGNGIARLNLSIAVNRSFKKGEQWKNEASFFEVQVWGKYAENLKGKIEKGCCVLVKGELRQDRWKDNNGVSKSKTYIVADTVKILGYSGTPETNGETTGNNTGDNFPEDCPF